ncbi:MAG: glycosyltransferase [Planctomycetes bacterium]|nr:glycosyltransferase [Planctomycetota bacterium]
MPEIILLCEYPTLNGGERSMLAVLDGLPAAGFSPVVMAPPGGPLADELAGRGVELLSFQCREIGGVRIPTDLLRRRLAQILSRRRPALLHANSLAMGRLSGPVAARLRLPSIAHLRDIVKLSDRAVADLNCHARLLAVSRATREFHVSGGLSAEKTCVLYNGVDLDEFHPRPPTGYLHRELGLSAEARLIGTIGQLGLRKGQDVLLRAAATIADRAPNVHYLIVGERNSNKDESRQFENDLHDASGGPLLGRVHFLGRRNDVAPLLNELTLLVHAARQEPLGRVLLEAAAAGTTVVAAEVGGTPEIFPPQCEAARLVEPDDSAALAAVIVELLDDEPLRRRLAAAARRRAETYFDSRTAANNLLQHYRAVAST